jgi:hypothetical protein
MSGKFGYQVVEAGKLPGNDWSATKDTMCAEWANSPEGKEVVEIDNSLAKCASCHERTSGE